MIRNIKNKNESRWGANFRRIWEEWGEQEIPTKILDWEMEMARDSLEIGLNKEIEQELQEDWSRIDNSSYFPIYKRINKGIGRESYFE